MGAHNVLVLLLPSVVLERVGTVLAKERNSRKESVSQRWAKQWMREGGWVKKIEGSQRRRGAKEQSQVACFALLACGRGDI